MRQLACRPAGVIAPESVRKTAAFSFTLRSMSENAMRSWRPTYAAKAFASRSRGFSVPVMACG